MSFGNKDYGLIDLHTLVTHYQHVLGTQVEVKLFGAPLICDKPVVTFNATRVPFAIADVRSETMNIEFICRLPYNRIQEIELEFKRILGYQRFGIIEKHMSILEDNGNVTTQDKEFYCTSFLERQATSGIDNSEGMNVAVLRVTGTLLVTDANGGAVMSNDVVTFAKLVGSDAKPAPLPIVYSSTNEGYNVENQVGTGEELQIPVPLTAQGGLTIQALYLARDFEKQLLVGLKNKQQKQIEITEVYDSNLTVKRVYNVLSMSEAKQAGAYMQYTLELQAYTTRIDEG